MSPRLLGYTRIFYWYDNGQYKPRVIEENKHTRVEYTSVRIHDGYILSSHEPSYFFPGRWFDCCDIFFVLSGFAMTIGYKDRVFNSDFSYSNYLLRRLSKFYPLHWLILFYILATHFTTLYQQDYFFAKLATNFLLIQSFVPSKDFYFAYNSPSWYLCNTLFYCVIFPFLLRFIVDCKRNVRRAFLVGLLSVYVLLIIFLPKEWHHAILYVNPFVRILDFVLGIYTVLLFFDLREDSKLVRQKSLLNTVVFVCFVVLALVSFSLTGTEVYELFKRFYWLLFCPMILAVSLKSVRGGYLQAFDNQAFGMNGSALKLLKCASKTMQWGGTYSFTFYLIHPLCIGLFSKICSKIGLEVWPTVFFTFTGVIVVSVLLQKFFVKPIAQIITYKFIKK